MTCSVPEDTAPSIFGWVEDPKGYTHCVVKRQPEAAEEIRQTLTAMVSAEAECIRYRGRSQEIFRRLAEIGAGQLADHIPPLEIQLVFRDRVTFKVEGAAQLKAIDLAVEFERYLEQVNSSRGAFPYKIRRKKQGKPKVEIAWFNDVFHTVVFEAIRTGSGYVAFAEPNILAVATPGLARLVDEWLRSSDRYTDLRWYSQKQWREGGPWRDTLV